MIYRFHNYELDTGYLELRKSGVRQKVEPQVFALLELLISNSQRVVSKAEINEHVWADRIVTDATVNSRIRSARLAIGDTGKHQKFIQTLHNNGFRFIGNPTISDRVSVQNYEIGALSETDVVDVADDPPRPSIAVLPFLLIGGEPKHRFFADAVSHEIIVELSRLHWLHITARGSSFRFRNHSTDICKVGKILQVRYVLTGSLRIADGFGICAVELLKTVDGSVVWADEFEGPIEDLLELQLKIVPRVVAIIEGQIQSAEARNSASIPTEDLDAWAAYHRGLWHMYRFNHHDNQIAGQMFKRAITNENSFARAYCGLSFTHFQNAFVGFTNDTENQRRLAKKTADRGFELDTFDPFANMTMGRTEMLFGNYGESIPWFERCLDLNPNYAFAHYSRGLADAVLCNGSDSQSHTMKAISLSPFDPLLYAMLCCRGLSHMVRGEYDAACDWAERGAIRPNSHKHIWAITAVAHELAGNREKAKQWAAKLKRVDASFSPDQFIASLPLGDDDTRADAIRSLKRLRFC